MAKAGQHKCMSCGEFFIPDHRKGQRQRYCCAVDCRRASQAASQAAWLAQPPNNDYFSGPVHVARVQIPSGGWPPAPAICSNVGVSLGDDQARHRPGW